MTGILIITGMALAVGGFAFYRAYIRRKHFGGKVWIVPIETLNMVTDEIEPEMIADGWGQSDYNSDPSKGPIKMCPEYANEWHHRLEVRLAKLAPDGLKAWIHNFSFQRDPRPDGSDPGRHQVVVVKTDDGLRAIDTYRINGSLYRQLSPDEWKNGYYL